MISPQILLEQQNILQNKGENFVEKLIKIVSTDTKNKKLSVQKNKKDSKDYLFKKDIEQICINIQVLSQKDIMPYFISETEKHFRLQHLKKVENKMKTILNKMKEIQTIYHDKWFAMSVTSFENIILKFKYLFGILLDQENSSNKTVNLDLRRSFYKVCMEHLKEKIPDWLTHFSENIFMLGFNTLPEPLPEFDQIHYDNDFSEFDISVSSNINSCFVEYKPVLEIPLVKEKGSLIQKTFDEYNFIDEYLIKINNSKINHDSKNNLISLLFANRKLYMPEHLSVKQIDLFYTYFINLLWKYPGFNKICMQLNDLLPFDKKGGMGFIAHYAFNKKFDEDLSSKEFFQIKKTIVKFQFDHDISIREEFIKPNSKLDRYLDYLQITYL